MSLRSLRCVVKFICQKQGFEALNQAQDDADEKRFANPRNAAAVCDSLIQKFTRERPLKFYAYAVGVVEG